jgi:hypothetical protein
MGRITKGGVMQGLMMERPLLISGLLEHAAAELSAPRRNNRAPPLPVMTSLRDRAKP